MILLVSTCKYRLSEEEFVKPVARIVEESGYKHVLRRYYEETEFSQYDKIVICGTALKDFEYLKYLSNFEKLLDYRGKVLGICAGCHILAKIYGNSLEELKKIGVYRVKLLKANPLTSMSEFNAYFLHIYSLSKVNDKLEPLALQENEVCLFKVKEKDFYGVSFHPEVLNRDIIENFLKL